MSRGRKYTEQFSLVGTTLQNDLIKAVEESPAIDGKAEVVRAGVNMLFGLNPDDEERLPEGVTFDEAVARALATIKPDRNAPVV